MEIFGVPVSEDTVKNTAVSGAVLLGLWQFVLKQLPWRAWLVSLLGRFLPPEPLPPVQASTGSVRPTEDYVANSALYTLRTQLKGDAQGQALLDSLASYWWKRDCEKPTEAK